MRTPRLLALAAAGAAALAVAVPSALAAGSAGSATIDVTLAEFHIVPTVNHAAPGKVTFKVKNSGHLVHEMIVVKTSLPAAKLKQKDGSADESASVGEVSELAAGKSGSVTLNLKAGKYILLCNVAGHFAAGQWTTFTVK